MLLSGAGFKAAFSTRDRYARRKVQTRRKSMSGCERESGARTSHAAYLRGATLQLRCQLAGAGARGRFQCEHRFKQRFQAIAEHALL